MNRHHEIVELQKAYIKNRRMYINDFYSFPIICRHKYEKQAFQLKNKLHHLFKMHEEYKDIYYGRKRTRIPKNKNEKFQKIMKYYC